MRIAKTLSIISLIYKKRHDLRKWIRFEFEAHKSFFDGYLPDEDSDNTFTADFLMRNNSYCPYEHFEHANTIYEEKLGQKSPKFLESLRKIADTKVRKYNYHDNIELYRIDTRSFSEIPDISLSIEDNNNLNFEEAGTFYKYIEDQLDDHYFDVGYYEKLYALHLQILIRSAYIQIYILRNGKRSRPKIAKLSKMIEKAYTEIYDQKSIFCLNPYLGIVWASMRNKEVQNAEIYSMKMIEICEEYINSMGNQYSFIANIHISVMYFIMNQMGRANTLFKEIMNQELEYVDNDKSHPFLEQIYLHLAIMYQSIEENNSALIMWKSLLKVHKRAYQNDSSFINKDYYNIGRCYLELGDFDKALYNVS
jgi:tetratricopeptide (TPR) repeat protein